MEALNSINRMVCQAQGHELSALSYSQSGRTAKYQCGRSGTHIRKIIPPVAPRQGLTRDIAAWEF